MYKRQVPKGCEELYKATPQWNTFGTIETPRPPQWVSENSVSSLKVNRVDGAICIEALKPLDTVRLINLNAVSYTHLNLYKSYFPLTYGGRSSAVIDVRMREGNSKKRKGSGTVGLIASKVMLEGPFKDGRCV